MVQLVADHRILVVQQRFENARVGIKARGVENRVLHAVELAACEPYVRASR
jgi:hypothetical protein